MFSLVLRRCRWSSSVVFCLDVRDGTVLGDMAGTAGNVFLVLHHLLGQKLAGLG